MGILTPDRLFPPHSIGSFCHRRGQVVGSWLHRGAPHNHVAIDACFTLTFPDKDFNSIKVKRRILVYLQALLTGLKAAESQPTNLAKMYDVRYRVILKKKTKQQHKRSETTESRPGKDPVDNHDRNRGLQDTSRTNGSQKPMCLLGP